MFAIYLLNHFCILIYGTPGNYSNSLTISLNPGKSHTVFRANLVANRISVDWRGGSSTVRVKKLTVNPQTVVSTRGRVRENRLPGDLTLQIGDQIWPRWREVAVPIL